MNITLQATNLTLSDNLKDLVNRKIGDAARAFGDMNMDPVQIAVELEKTTSRHPQERTNEQLFRVEANVSVPGQLIRVEESAMDLEQAIVKMKHTLTREIRHWRERKIEERRKGARKAKSIAIDGDAAVPVVDRTEDWEEEWASEEEHAQMEALEAEDEKWEEWEEGGEDQRDFV